MTFALNMLWFASGGMFLGLIWCVAGIMCFLSIIMIPFGIACFRIADMAFCPFGKELVHAECMGEKPLAGAVIGNVAWVLMFGWWISLIAAIVGVMHCVTIVGIPWGVAYFRIAEVSLCPLGKRVVSKDVACLAKQQYERWL